ncbi:shufflon system plasmid conjugative transfer pilus tip adhesin PilV [Pectobacterium cacticida]|uniref:shufflon system plasmid conjugative transfer pilus tip adhesin PilV n=1 Tax=Pectobacterium cacticida TaxID=69221 RepID=UPI002FF00EFF
MIKHKKGFSLLEITLVLGVGTAMAFMKFQDMKSDQEKVMANTVGSQMKQMGEAVNRYVSIRYDKLSTLTSSSSQTSDPGPRTCSANGCEITYQTLVNEGLLPAGYTGVNMQKSSYKILLKRAGTAPNYVINGLVITTEPWLEGNRIRYDLLGRAMQAAGIDSGMTQSATVASGTGGQWTENQSNYAEINAAGLLAYRVGYDSSMYSVYLRRDGTLPMTGDLNMGGNDINHVKDMTASGTVSASNVIASNSITGKQGMINDYLGVGLSQSRYKKEKTGPAAFYGNYTLEVNGNQVNFGNIVSTENIVSGKDFIGRNGNGDLFYLGGYDADDYELRVGSDKPLTIYRMGGEKNNELRLRVFGRQEIWGDLHVRSQYGRDTEGNIVASGNISAAGTVSGQYLQPTSISIPGEGCIDPGAISKDSAGKVLSCVSGEWQSMAGGLQEYNGQSCPEGLQIFVYYAYIRESWTVSNHTSSRYYTGWVTASQLNKISYYVTNNNKDNETSHEYHPFEIWGETTKVKCG